MPAKRIESCLWYICSVNVIFLTAASVSAQADSRLDVGPLPETLIKPEQCISADDRWGWDGEQTCLISSFRLAGEPYRLTQTHRDTSGTDLVWNNNDLAGKTVRCDSYERAFLPSADPKHEYTRARYDITFMTDDSIPATAAGESLSDVTAHLFTRGWSIGQFGRLETGLQPGFTSIGFTTEVGYIFIEDSASVNSDGERIVRSFSHCWLRDESAPLRATGYCVDYDGDGIGWNGTGECAVAPVSPNCDYSASRFNAGWGFNSLTGESCPPVDNTASFTAEDRCIGNSPDGWGWNQALLQSCRVEE